MARNPVPAPVEPDLDDFQAQDDHRTLQRAGEVMTSPKRMSAVRRHHKRVMGAMNKVLGGKPPSFRGGGR